MAIQSIEEGLALYSLGLLRADEIPELALLFLAGDCDVPEMAALAGSLAIEHPADLRSDLERAVRLAGRAFPPRIEAAQMLKRIYAERGSSGVLSPRDAAGLIKELFRAIEAELPATQGYVGDSFGIAAVIGLYYSYDDTSVDDIESTSEIDRDLRDELARLAGAIH